MNCVLKFAVDCKVRLVKLSISNKCALKCAGEYKVEHVSA